MPFFFIRHGAGGDGEALSIGKLDHNTKQVSPRLGLSKHIMNWIFTCGLGAPYPCFTEAHILNLLRLHSVPCNVINTVLWPNKLMDAH